MRDSESGRLIEGMKVRYRPRPDWGVGHLAAHDEQGARAAVFFPGREDPIIVSTKGGTVERHAFEAGEVVLAAPGEEPFLILEALGAGERSPLLRYRLRPAREPDEGRAEGEGEEIVTMDEAALRAAPPSPELADSLREGRVGDARSFTLRREALLLDDERRSDALGALFASRVMPLPYQVGVVQRVLSSPRPRFILADEVGLGKTIEAGMIFSALRLSGLARRVLVVAPTHLTVQWLVELAHKFNRLFTLMDGDRYSRERSISGEVSPWSSHDLVITSLELLSRDERHRAEVGAPEAAWDLVIIDEAHHLRGRRAYEAAEALAANTFGLLLLTATPMQLDPEEYHRLLGLVDPETAPSLEALKLRISRQEEISRAVQSLVHESKSEEAERALLDLASRFPDDPVLAGAADRPPRVFADATEREALLSHIAETYSLSDRLIRNRRATAGGFTKRRLHRHRFDVPEEEKKAREKIIARLREEPSVHGAVLTRLLRNLESSPAALIRALKSPRDPSAPVVEAGIAERDAKSERFLGVLSSIKEHEPTAKVLIFTESRATLDWLVTLLGREGTLALAYHGDLSLVERDRRVARFRDPGGPDVLISTEVGGEGRNFQFCHHVVHYDLPWSPATVEQRIGRLDRIGQTFAVDIHVLEPIGTLTADVVSILDEAVGVFEETVGGLDVVLEEVEPRLLDLALRPAGERRRYSEELAAKVAGARERMRRAYDPLLDIRSASKDEVAALARRAVRRLGLEEDLSVDVGAAGKGGKDELEKQVRELLWAVARDLDERLEETVTEIAARIGMGVDLEEQVEAFQCAFHFGHALKVDALPGIDITKEETVLGTFWRDTAISHEEIEYFATGHRIVESLMGFLRDGPFGRAAFRVLGPPERLRDTEPLRGVELLFHLEDPRPEDVEAGSRYPARLLARFIEDRLLRVVVTLEKEGAARVVSTLGRRRAEGAAETVGGRDGSDEDEILLILEDEGGHTLRGDEIPLVFPAFHDFVPRAMELGEEEAERILHARKAAVRAAIEAERDRALTTLELSGRHQRLSKEPRAERSTAAAEHYRNILDALDALRPVLDSACGFVSVGRGGRRTRTASAAEA